MRARLLINRTPQEIALWNRIKNRNLGALFTQQKVIIGYIVDFYSQKYRLAIEVDGSYHNARKDHQRDMSLNNVGVYVLRFTNEQIDNEMEKVLQEIKAKLVVSTTLYKKRQTTRFQQSRRSVRRKY